MRAPRYTFDLVCPRCNRQDMVETDNRDVPPRLCCGDCLMLNVETIELKVVRVMVLA